MLFRSVVLAFGFSALVVSLWDTRYLVSMSPFFALWLGAAIAWLPGVLRAVAVRLPAPVAHRLPPLALPAGLTALPAGAAYGANVHGPAEPYAGPHTHDANRHAYHAQVFALDRVLTAEEAADIAALQTSLRGHVLAAGELVGYASKPADAEPEIGRAHV